MADGNDAEPETCSMPCSMRGTRRRRWQIGWVATTLHVPYREVIQRSGLIQCQEEDAGLFKTGSRTGSFLSFLEMLHAYSLRGTGNRSLRGAFSPGPKIRPLPYLARAVAAVPVVVIIAVGINQ